MADTPNEALELAQVIEDDANEHLPVSRSEIAAMLRSQSAEIERLKAQVESALSCAENANKLSTEFLREREQLKAKNDSLVSWLGSNMTFYDVNTQCSTQHPNIPVLASVSKRIWYHATDNQLDFPFSQVVRSALKENT